MRENLSQHNLWQKTAVLSYLSPLNKQYLQSLTPFIGQMVCVTLQAEFVCLL